MSERFRVVRSDSLGLHYWVPGQKGCRNRNRPVTQIVVHTTGGEGKHDRVINTLKKRGLSIHYIVSDGQVYQCADPDTTVTYHAGAANAHSIGIEVRNSLKRIGVSATRGKRADRIQGKNTKTTNIYSEDMLALCFLINSLCNAYQIPKKVLLSDKMMSGHLAYNGIVGHFHLSRKKIDPGLRALQDLDYFLKSLP